MLPRSQAHEGEKRLQKTLPKFNLLKQAAVCWQQRVLVSQAPVLVLFHLLYVVGFTRDGEKSSLNLPHAVESIKVE